MKTLLQQEECCQALTQVNCHLFMLLNLCFFLNLLSIFLFFSFVIHCCTSLYYCVSNKLLLLSLRYTIISLISCYCYIFILPANLVNILWSLIQFVKLLGWSGYRNLKKHSFFSLYWAINESNFTAKDDARKICLRTFGILSSFCRYGVFAF